MRTSTGLLLVGLALLSAAACSRPRVPSNTPSDATLVGDVHVFVVNRSSEETISVVVYVDDEEVLRGTYPQLARTRDLGGTRLRLPVGIHRVRAVVGSVSTEAEVEVTTVQACSCQIIWYDEPEEFAPGRFSRLSVAQIYPC